MPVPTAVRRARMIAMCAAALVLLLVAVPGAGAATYSVSYAASADAPWTNELAPGFAANGWRITAAGTLATGSTGAFVLRSDTAGLRIESARLTVQFDRSVAGVVGRVASRDGAVVTPTEVVGAPGTHVLEVDRPGEAIEVGLHASGAVASGSATLDVVDATVELDDLRPPQVTGATATLGGGCVQFAVTAVDGESGLASMTLRDRRSLVTLGTWTAPRGSGLHPGSSTASWQPCIPVGLLANGVGSIDVDAVDIAGQHAFAAVVQVGAAPVPSTPFAAAGSPTANAASAPIAVEVSGTLPSVVIHGSPIRVPVRVTRAGTGAPGRSVQLRSSGGAVLAGARTDASGRATLRGTVRGPAPVQLVVVGSNVARRLPMQVAPRVTWRASAASVDLGSVVVLRGTVAPASACRSVTLRARRGAGWFEVRSVRCGDRGTFQVPVTANARGSFRLRAHVGASGGWGSGASSVRSLRVR